MEQIGQEIRHAVRRLLHSPAFTVAAVLTLALAIGANVAIFTVVERVVIRPLPYPNSDRLIELSHGLLGLNLPSGVGLTPGLYFLYADRARSLDSAAIYQSNDATVTGDGEPERIRITQATASLAAVLRVAPALGRWFTQAEALPGGPEVAVLSHGLWVRRYGADPNVLSRTITVAGIPRQIIGVMPPAFAFPDTEIAAWVADRVTRGPFGTWDYSGVARLRDGATLDDARAESTGLIADVPNAYPNDTTAIGNVQAKMVFTGRALKDVTVGSVERALWILLGSVGLVLLVACANVSNLFLVRSEARQREVAVRRALGAGRFGIARYFVIESLVLSALGGAAGFGLAWGALRLLARLEPANLPRLHEIHLDASSLAVTFTLSVLAALAFGALPLWRIGEVSGALHEGGRGNTASRGRYRARHVLMGAQMALALVLLVASGLLVRSFEKLRAVDLGFNAASALTFSLGLPDQEYTTRASALAAHHAVIDRLSQVPGVTAVSASTCLPLVGACHGNTLRVEGRTYPAGTIPPLALFRAVAGDYFTTIGMRLVRGRFIDRGDVERGEPIAVVNEVLAKQFFPEQDPIGRRVASNRPPAKPGRPPDLTWLTIVGVVSNTPIRVLADPNPLPQIYLPMSLARGPDSPPTERTGPTLSVMRYVIRTAIPPRDIVGSVRRAVAAVDGNLAIAQVRTLEEMVDGASAQMAFTMVLLAIAAAVALMLGVIGIYGVMSYIVTQRTSEIGVRLALGAEPRNVAGQIVRQGGGVALAGIAVGLAAAFAGSRLIESLLYGVTPRDPGVFVATTLGLLLVALVACWLPARRAARLSPLEALRSE